jgi:hypothetical protein
MNDEYIDILIYNNQLNLNTMLPAKVLSFDKESNTASIKITIKLNQEYPDLFDVPVYKFCTGNTVIEYDLKEGTQGFVLFFQRDIGAGENRPLRSKRTHDLNDNLFIPAYSHQPVETPNKVSLNEDSIELVSKSESNQTSLLLTPDKIIMKGNLEVDGEIKASNDVLAGNISLQNHTHTGLGKLGVIVPPSTVPIPVTDNPASVTPVTIDVGKPE